jgi:drug/metabolite transporter (DMT)-like permease
MPLSRRGLVPLIILGIGNTTIPFALITWGEKSISSGLAAMLQSTASLFTLVAAHFYFADERITPQKIVGLAVGFLGVAVLASRSVVDGQLDVPQLTGSLAIVLASLCYAIFGVYSRKIIQNRLEPMIVSAGALTFAAITSGVGMIAAPFLGGQAATPLDSVSGDVLAAVITLGLLNTFIAYIIFYGILNELGAARTSMVTYVVPGVGLALGAIVLHEQIDWRLIAGALLIFAGIGIVNLRVFSRIAFRRGASVGG